MTPSRACLFTTDTSLHIDTSLHTDTSLHIISLPMCWYGDKSWPPAEHAYSLVTTSLHIISLPLCRCRGKSWPPGEYAPCQSLVWWRQQWKLRPSCLSCLSPHSPGPWPLEAERRVVSVTVSVHSHMQTHLHTDILWSLTLEAERRVVSVTVSVHSHMQTHLHTDILLGLCHWVQRWELFGVSQ